MLRDLGDMINRRIGTCFPRQRRHDLLRGVRTMTRTLGFDTPEACVRAMLASEHSDTYLDALVECFTVGETFFFRDRHTLKTFESRILPELLTARRDVSRMRIWSAACCTGEEPYTLSMILERYRLELQGVKVSILATDLNQKFLDKAKSGLYTRWSFRDTPDAMVQSYFAREGKNLFRLAENIRRQVVFKRLNLIHDAYPSDANGTRNMDVIFCRNVLMYFSSEQRREVVGRMVDCLNDGGWFVVSPSETAFVDHPRLESVRFENAIMHRKGAVRQHALSGRQHESALPPECPANNTNPGFSPLPGFPLSQPSSPIPNTPTDRAGERGDTPHFLNTVTEAPAPRVAPGVDVEAVCEKARGLVACGLYEDAATELEEVLAKRRNGKKPGRVELEAIGLLTRAYANLGVLDKAQDWCEYVILHDKFNAGHRYLLATIHEERGEFDQAAKTLNQALYLDPDFAIVHFALAILAKKRSRHAEAAKHLKNASSVLAKLDNDEILPHSEGMTAGRLLGVIRAMIKENGTI